MNKNKIKTNTLSAYPFNTNMQTLACRVLVGYSSHLQIVCFVLNLSKTNIQRTGIELVRIDDYRRHLRFHLLVAVTMETDGGFCEIGIDSEAESRRGARAAASSRTCAQCSPLASSHNTINIRNSLNLHELRNSAMEVT